MRAKDENKEIIIREKAIEMIVKDGFQGLSMQKLAKAAGISASTIYIYFEHKEDLLNKLFYYAEDLYATAALKDFEPRMNFEQGLWLQWKNRYKYILEHTLHFHFLEQFRNSSLIRHKDIKDSLFKPVMKEFIDHARKRNEIEDLPSEILWALAYSPLYTLIKFHLLPGNQNRSFHLTEAKLKQTFLMVMKSLKI